MVYFYGIFINLFYANNNYGISGQNIRKLPEGANENSAESQTWAKRYQAADGKVR
jgi:hypothetical protein